MKIQQQLSEFILTQKKLNVTIAVVPDGWTRYTELQYANIAPGDYQLLLLRLLADIEIPGTVAIVQYHTGGIIINHVDDNNYAFKIVDQETYESLKTMSLYDMVISQHAILATSIVRREVNVRTIRKLYGDVRIVRTICNLELLLNRTKIKKVVARHTGSYGSNDIYTGIKAGHFKDLERQPLPYTSGRYGNDISADFFIDKLPGIKPHAVDNDLSVLVVSPHLLLIYSPKFSKWCVSQNMLFDI